MVVGVDSLTAQIKQLQNAIQNRQWEVGHSRFSVWTWALTSLRPSQDAANVLRVLKKVDATEELLRVRRSNLQTRMSLTL